MSALDRSALHPSTWRRRWHARPGRQARLASPVVSVGNLALGGRGKSPLVARITRLLLEAGERPAILSRGYGRRAAPEGVVVVSDGRHLLADLDTSGDEPLMLARELPGAAVLVCPERRLAGELAERRFGATVHVLDDGFQHLALHRDVDVVVIAPEDLAGRPLPLGRLRESPVVLASAHALVLDGPPDADLPAPAAEGQRVFRMRRVTGQAAPLDPDAPWPPPARDAVVAAGIVRPERLAAAARELGWTVRETIAFADHHLYSRRDVERIAHAARRAGACVVLTTAKDAVRLRPLRPLPVPVGVIPLSVEVEPPEAFAAWLIDRVRGAR